MKSIKPGRGPSAMGALGGIAAAVFGVFWIIFAVSIGAPGIFPLFGVIFIALAIVGSVYNYKNATGTNRMSVFDITEDNEEPDPLQTRFNSNTDSEGSNNTNTDSNLDSYSNVDKDSNTGINFCPFCRCELKSNYNFCPKCGNDLSSVK